MVIKIAYTKRLNFTIDSITWLSSVVKLWRPTKSIYRKSQLLLQQNSYYSYTVSKIDIGAFKVISGAYSWIVVSAIQVNLCYQLQKNIFFFPHRKIMEKKSIVCWMAICTCSSNHLSKLPGPIDNSVHSRVQPGQKESYVFKWALGYSKWLQLSMTAIHLAEKNFYKHHALALNHAPVLCEDRHLSLHQFLRLLPQKPPPVIQVISASCSWNAAQLNRKHPGPIADA